MTKTFILSEIDKVELKDAADDVTDAHKAYLKAMRYKWWVIQIFKEKGAANSEIAEILGVSTGAIKDICRSSIKQGKNAMTEAETWLSEQPKTEEGKIDITIVIAEGQKRGYCICPKPMRQMINFDGLTCKWCGMPETRESFNFWYKE